MLKIMPFAALAVIVAVPVPGASPNNPVQSIIVRAEGAPTMQKWVNRLTGKLEHNLVPIRALNYGERTDGYAVVQFSCGSDGLAHDIALTQSSNNRLVARAAMRAVARLNSLHPMPIGITTGQKVRANIIFAESEDGLAKQLRMLRRDETRRGAAGSSDNGERIVILDAVLRVQS